MQGPVSSRSPSPIRYGPGPLAVLFQQRRAPAHNKARWRQRLSDPIYAGAAAGAIAGTLAYWRGGGIQPLRRRLLAVGAATPFRSTSSIRYGPGPLAALFQQRRAPAHNKARWRQRLGDPISAGAAAGAIAGTPAYWRGGGFQPLRRRLLAVGAATPSRITSPTRYGPGPLAALFQQRRAPAHNKARWRQRLSDPISAGAAAGAIAGVMGASLVAGLRPEHTKAQAKAPS